MPEPVKPTFLRVEDMTPEQRAEHEECLANMPIHAMIREWLREDFGDQAADEYQTSYENDLFDQ
jgi:hypothetical protein